MTDGEVFVHGLTAENAQMLLKGASDNDFDSSVVRTSEDGFYIPSDLANILFPPPKKKSKDDGQDDDPEPPVKEG
jgi:hypothetical protein